MPFWEGMTRGFQQGVPLGIRAIESAGDVERWERQFGLREKEAKAQEEEREMLRNQKQSLEDLAAAFELHKQGQDEPALARLQNIYKRIPDGVEIKAIHQPKKAAQAGFAYGYPGSAWANEELVVQVNTPEGKDKFIPHRNTKEAVDEYLMQALAFLQPQTYIKTMMNLQEGIRTFNEQQAINPEVLKDKQGNITGYRLFQKDKNGKIQRQTLSLEQYNAMFGGVGAGRGMSEKERTEYTRAQQEAADRNATEKPYLGQDGKYWIARHRVNEEGTVVKEIVPYGSPAPPMSPEMTKLYGLGITKPTTEQREIVAGLRARPGARKPTAVSAASWVKLADGRVGWIDTENQFHHVEGLTDVPKGELTERNIAAIRGAAVKEYNRVFGEREAANRRQMYIIQRDEREGTLRGAELETAKRALNADMSEIPNMQDYIEEYVNRVLPPQQEPIKPSQVPGGVTPPSEKFQPQAEPGVRVFHNKETDKWIQLYPDGRQVEITPPSGAVYKMKMPREKGPGYFGELKRAQGGVSTEISVGVDFGQGETEIPLLVPTLTKDEINYLLTKSPSDSDLLTTPTGQAVYRKAVDHAKGRITEGKSPFAQPGEQKAQGIVEPTTRRRKKKKKKR
jgi:hypothetical protein